MEENQQTQFPEEESIKRVGNQQYVLIALAVFFLFMVGLIMYGMGFFKDKNPEKQSENDLHSLAPPEAKPKNLETEKYKYGSTEKKDPQTDANSVQNLRMITGKEVLEKANSNEFLNEEDYKAVDNSANNRANTAHEKKSNLNRKTQARLSAVQRQQAYYANPNTALYQKSKAEIREENLDRKEAEVNQRTAELMLKNLENYQKNPQINPNLANSENQKQMDKQFNLETTSNDKVSKEAETTEIIPEIEKNTIGKIGQKVGAFYGLTPNAKKYYRENEGILAVIHGDGEAITVQNGSILKIRLLEASTLQIKGQKIRLEAGSFLTGECQINSDRVIITAKNLRIDNLIFPITLTVFDLDGQLGLYVPNLKTKNRVNQELVNTGNQTVSGTNIFTNSGGIGQQVGTQMAVNASRSLMNGAKSIFRAKMANAKVTIKSNYKIILKSSNLSQNTPIENEEFN